MSPRIAVRAGGVRVAFLVFGGMAALQSSPSLDAAKLVYLVGASLAFAGASRAYWRRRHSEAAPIARPWLLAGVGMIVLTGISLLVATTQGTPRSDALRDAATYLLFASVPVFALDAQESVPRRWLVAMLVIAGVLGGFSWALEWLARRDILELPLTRLFFPSPQLPAMLYFFATAMAFLGGRRSWAWALLAGLILGLFLVTGTRSSLLLFAGPIAMAFVAGRDRLSTSAASLFVEGAAAVVVVLAIQVALWVGPSILPVGMGSPNDPGGNPHPEVIGDRYGDLGAVVADPGSDPSIRERVAQYGAALELFSSSPIVGVGLGHAIVWTDVSGYERIAYTADTPLVFMVKFGLLGLIALVLIVVAYLATLRDLLRYRGRTVVSLTLVGYAAWTLLALPLGFPIEDKGTSLALILILALAFEELLTEGGHRDSEIIKPILPA